MEPAWNRSANWTEHTPATDTALRPLYNSRRQANWIITSVSISSGSL